MKRYESGEGMTIVMKYDATEKQIEIAKKLYPYAKIIKEPMTISFTKNISYPLTTSVVAPAFKKTTLNKSVNYTFGIGSDYYTYQKKNKCRYEIKTNFSSVA